MLTRQLMDLFEATAVYSHLHCLIEVALVEEFGFICHLKRIMIVRNCFSFEGMLPIQDCGFEKDFIPSKNLCVLVVKNGWQLSTYLVKPNMRLAHQFNWGWI